MMYRKIGEEDYRAPVTEVVEEFGDIRSAGAPDSKISETSSSNRRCISTNP